MTEKKFKIELGGRGPIHEKYGREMGIRTVTEEEAENSDLVACFPMRLKPEGTPLIPGSYVTECARCGEEIGVGPDAPRKPPKVCVGCVKSWLEEKQNEQ